MKASHILTTCLAGLALASFSTPIFADESQADCEVRERGDKKRGQSGPCLFSQRQGYIDIRLNNGKNYSLSPHGGANKFRDQDGKRVERIEASGNMHKYKWEHRNITVTFHDSAQEDSGYGSSHSYEPETTTHYVRMENGGAELSDNLTPGSSKRYTFNARNRDDLYVRVAPRGSGVYYQIFNPDNSFLLEQISSDKEYRGELWQSGEHVVEVINRGNRDVSYNIIIGLQ